MQIYMIGCGGIGGWLAQCLAKTLTKDDVLTLMDKDKLEPHNLDRQLFDENDVGLLKAEAMSRYLRTARCKVKVIPEFLGADLDFEFDSNSFIFVGADNHPARFKSLNLCDATNSSCIVAANGYECAEAYYYNWQWEGMTRDPREYYPELATDHEDDPLSPPCTGEVLESAPQLAVANMDAASYAMWLFWFWTQKAPELRSEEARATSPVHVTSTAGRSRVITLGEYNV